MQRYKGQTTAFQLWNISVLELPMGSAEACVKTPSHFDFSLSAHPASFPFFPQLSIPKVHHEKPSWMLFSISELAFPGKLNLQHLTFMNQETEVQKGYTIVLRPRH